MDLKTAKLELIHLMLKTEKIEVLQQIKKIFEENEQTDFWESLSTEDQEAIDEGLQQLDNKKFVSHGSVQKEIKSRFNF